MQTPPSSESYQELSAAVAVRAAAQAADVGSPLDTAEGIARAAAVVVRYQAASAAQVPRATSLILDEQDAQVPPVATLNPAAFTTDPAAVASMMETIEREAEDLWTSHRFELLVTSLVQDAARLAQQVDVTTRPRVGYVRHLTPPSCSRCAVLAGRVYRWSQGFLRHPGCDCTMMPSTVGARYVQDPSELAAQGLVTGLSKADRKALAAGADFNQLANAKRGLRTAEVFGRRIQVTTAGTTSRGLAGKRLGDLQKGSGRYRETSRLRLTPNEIYRQADDDRDLALRLLEKHGYIL